LTEQQGVLRADLREVPRALRDALGGRDRLAARFELPVEDGVLYLSRTHPVIEALASHVMETALDAEADGVARRAGAIRTRAVARRTTLLLLRLRYDMVTRQRDAERSQLAEECRLLAFAGPPDAPEWLDETATEALLRAEPGANIYPEQAAGFVRSVVEAFDRLRPRLEEEAQQRARALLDAHRRVREGAGLRGVSYRVTPQLPVDMLGIYVYLPLG
jgi:hypothetical protein